MPKRIVSKHRAFLAAFRVTANLTKAAKAAGVDRQDHYTWLAGVTGYRALFEAAQEQAAQTLEDEAVRRAHEGVIQAEYYQGKAIGTKRIYSDGLMMFLLRALRPNKYRERRDIELTGAGGGPLVVSIAEVLRDRRAKREAPPE